MRRYALVLLATVTAAACGGTATPTATPLLTPATSNRPSSDVKVTIVSPTNGEVVHGNTVHVVVTVSGGTVTPNYSTQISPTVGHVHLYMQNQLVYMSYTLSQDLPVSPGLSYALYAEWVAADHFPFNPRDITPTVVFTTAAS
jgi:hypothetical protein